MLQKEPSKQTKNWKAAAVQAAVYLDARQDKELM